MRMIKEIILAMAIFSLTGCSVFQHTEEEPVEQSKAPEPTQPRDWVTLIPYSENYWIVRLDHGVALRSVSSGTFASGKATLQPESAVFLDEVAAVLNDQLADKSSILIAGHTDAHGNRATNMKLSKLRAKNVMDALVARNVNPVRLKFEGFGSSVPIAENTSKEGRQQNRRTEIIILDEPKVETSSACTCSCPESSAVPAQTAPQQQYNNE